MNGQKRNYNNIIFKESWRIMDLEKKDNNSIVIKYQKTDNVLQDVCSIIDSAKDFAYNAVNIALVERNWLIG